VTTSAARALRVLAPNDVRLIWRDGFLLMIVLVSPLTCLLLRWLVPYRWSSSATTGSSWPTSRSPCSRSCSAPSSASSSSRSGTRVPCWSFLGYRLLAAMATSVVLTMVAIPLAGLVSISPLELLATALLASPGVPLVALAYATYIQNKVQAVTAIKLVQAWGGLPVLLYFAPTPWQWIGSVPGPLYYPVRLFWSAAEGGAEWWLILPGVALQGAAVLWLLRRFQRAVYT
jgi:hypothetical protein